MEARLAREQARGRWWRRALRWIKREAADYRVRPILRRETPTERDQGYFPTRLGRPQEGGEK